MRVRFTIFALLALLGCLSVAYGQSSAVSTITVNTASALLSIINSDGGVDDVIRGHTYTVVYDAYAATSVVSPNNNGETPNGDVGVDITGDPSSNVVVTMDLPDMLLGVAGTSMAITFPGSGPASGVVGETGGFFNPHIQNTFNLGAGLLTLRLGYVFTVPPEVTIAGEIFMGQILTNTYYTGL